MNKHYYNSNQYSQDQQQQQLQYATPEVEYNPYGKKCPCESPYVPNCTDDAYAIGNSIDFSIDKCDSEIKADAVISYRNSVRVWGQIRDCDGNPVPYAYLKLVKLVDTTYVGVAHTISDCMGFYQFDICPCTDGTNFKLIVGKASKNGREKVVSTGITGTNCNPCNAPAPCDCK